MGIEQLLRALAPQHQRHGIHRELTARKILLDGPLHNLRVLPRSGIGLHSGTGQIKQHTIDGRLSGAELLMKTHLRDTFSPQPLAQIMQESNA